MNGNGPGKCRNRAADDVKVCWTCRWLAAVVVIAAAAYSIPTEATYGREWPAQWL